MAAARVAMATSNVYYLPPPMPAAERAPAPSRLPAVRRTWWRLRFALAGLRLAFRPAPVPLFEDDPRANLDGGAEVIERRPRPSQPARVIDFDRARARLRAVPSS